MVIFGSGDGNQFVRNEAGLYICRFNQEKQ